MPPRIAGYVRLLFVVTALVSFGCPAGAEPMKDFAEGNNGFARQLFARTSGKVGNMVQSPVGVSAALTVLGGGARGATAAQFRTVLQMPDFRSAFVGGGELVRLLRSGSHEGPEIAMGVALWGQKGADFRPDFIRAVDGQFGAALKEVDSAGDPEAVRKSMNAWSNEATREKIPEPLPAGALRPEVKLVVTTAVYFKGAWGVPFREGETKMLAFQLDNDQRVPVPTMHHRTRFAYGVGDGFEALRLPYRGGEYSMIILLPSRAGGLPGPVRAIAAKLPPMPSSMMGVFLPRFRFESDINLDEVLPALGLTEAMTPRADFSGMTAMPGFRVSDVFQKACIEVNEQGAEAAAFTAGPTLGGGSDKAPEPPSIFRVDRPFAFLIRHEASGAIIFSGRVSDPRAN